MFFLVPYAVDVPFDRKPVTNWLLVISVIAAFSFQFACYDGGELENQPFAKYVLDGWHWQGLFGHLWLHGDPLHLAGNTVCRCNSHPDTPGIRGVIISTAPASCGSNATANYR